MAGLPLRFLASVARGRLVRTLRECLRSGRGGLGAGALALDPALDVALPPAGHRDLARTDVLGQGGTGGQVGAVRDRARGDDHRVAPDERVLADEGRVLL